MTHGMLAEVTCLLLLLSLAGVCIAEEAPGYTLYMQGGESSITEDGDGMKITIQDIVPYFFTASGNQSMLLRVSVVPMLPLPINAALIFSETDGNPASLVKITNLSFSDDNKTLILQIKPLEFYEGEMLKAYAKDAIPVNSLERELKNKNTALYLELVSNLPENWKAGDENCFTECLCSSTLIAQSPYNPVTMEMAAWCKALCRTKDEIYYNECWNTPGCSGAK